MEQAIQVWVTEMTRRCEERAEAVVQLGWGAVLAEEVISNNVKRTARRNEVLVRDTMRERVIFRLVLEEETDARTRRWDHKMWKFNGRPCLVK